MITEKKVTMILAVALIFSWFNRARVNPDNIKQMAVLAFMLIQPGEILLRMEILPIHPISTISPTATTIILKRKDSSFSLVVSFGCL